MNILVCIKQVPDDSVEIHLNAEGTPDFARVPAVFYGKLRCTADSFGSKGQRL